MLVRRTPGVSSEVEFLAAGQARGIDIGYGGGVNIDHAIDVMLVPPRPGEEPGMAGSNDKTMGRTTDDQPRIGIQPDSKVDVGHAQRSYETDQLVPLLEFRLHKNRSQ